MDRKVGKACKGIAVKKAAVGFKVQSGVQVAMEIRENVGHKETMDPMDAVESLGIVDLKDWMVILEHKVSLV